MTESPSSSSRVAFIVATGHHDDPALIDVPGALKSAQRITSLLGDSTAVIRAFDQVLPISDPSTSTEVLLPLADSATSAQDVLLFYFSGHGLLTPRGDLCLSTSRTVLARPEFTTISFEHVAQLFRESPAHIKIIILDCCFAGRATNALSASDVAAFSGVEGVHTLAATTRNRPAHVPPHHGDEKDQPPTSFTHELLALIEEGIPGAGESLSINDLFPQLSLRLARKGLPRPSQSISDGAAGFPLFRNAAFLPLEDLVAPEASERNRQSTSSIDVKSNVSESDRTSTQPRRTVPAQSAKLHLMRVEPLPATMCVLPMAAVLGILSADESLIQLSKLAGELGVPVSVLASLASAVAVTIALTLAIGGVIPVARPTVVLAEPKNVNPRRRRARLHVSRVSFVEPILVASVAGVLAAPLHPDLLRHSSLPFLPYLACFTIVTVLTVAWSNSVSVDRRHRPTVELAEPEPTQNSAELIVSRLSTLQVALLGVTGFATLLVLGELLRYVSNSGLIAAKDRPAVVGGAVMILALASLVIFNATSSRFDGLRVTLSERRKDGTTEG